MDSITHLTQKILVERARQDIQQTHQIPDTAPPPYIASEDNDDKDSDSDSDASSDEDNDPEDSPFKLTINAANTIQGSNNLVPTSPSPLADATKFSALLLHAVNRINASAARPKRRFNVELTINCGVTIVGDRNVVGNVALKPKAPEKAIAGPGAVMAGQDGAATVGGAKRKAVETPDDEPRQKRAAVLHAQE